MKNMNDRSNIFSGIKKKFGLFHLGNSQKTEKKFIFLSRFTPAEEIPKIFYKINSKI